MGTHGVLTGYSHASESGIGTQLAHTSATPSPSPQLHAHSRAHVGAARTRAHAQTHTRSHARTHAQTHTRTPARTHAHTHARTRTHTHAHTRTHRPRSVECTTECGPWSLATTGSGSDRASCSACGVGALRRPAPSARSEGVLRRAAPALPLVERSPSSVICCTCARGKQGHARSGRRGYGF
jgi:hypothetical protein